MPGSVLKASLAAGVWGMGAPKAFPLGPFPGCLLDTQKALELRAVGSVLAFEQDPRPGDLVLDQL